MLDGDTANYYNFVWSFTNVIEAKTNDSKKHLHYLAPYTCGANFATSGNDTFLMLTLSHWLNHNNEANYEVFLLQWSSRPSRSV